MVFNLWRRRAPAAIRPLDRLAKPQCDRRLYIIGDVHGRSDLLDRLLDAIGADWRESRAERFEIVFVGDYIDRGDDSSGVVEQVMALNALVTHDNGAVTALMGNHEAFLLDFLDAPELGPDWLRYGALQTLASYGVAPPSSRADADAWRDCAAQLRARMGVHLTFIASLQLARRIGNIFVCHAAVDPDAPLDRQLEDSLLWGNESFLKRGGPDGWVVVHGHTISDGLDVGRNRVGVDTGAFSSGRLTALVVDPEDGYSTLTS